MGAGEGGAAEWRAAHCRPGRSGARADVRAGGCGGGDFSRRLRLPGLTDSKQLTEKQRNEFDAAIRDCAVAWAIAAVDVETIDRINIRRASLLAMRMAVEQLAAESGFAAARLSAD